MIVTTTVFPFFLKKISFTKNTNINNNRSMARFTWPDFFLFFSINSRHYMASLHNEYGTGYNNIIYASVFTRKIHYIQKNRFFFYQNTAIVLTNKKYIYNAHTSDTDEMKMAQKILVF